MRLSYEENIKPLTEREERVLCRIMDAIMRGYEAQYGKTNSRYRLSKKEYEEAEKRRIQRIEDVIKSDPHGNGEFLAYRAKCSKQTLNNYRARLRKRGVI